VLKNHTTIAQAKTAVREKLRTCFDSRDRSGGPLVCHTVFDGHQIADFLRMKIGQLPKIRLYRSPGSARALARKGSGLWNRPLGGTAKAVEPVTTFSTVFFQGRASGTPRAGPVARTQGGTRGHRAPMRD
jgi:hypothetical protein